ncbi:MAG: hypothetical protein AB1758_14715 [Candidatus Eremiobacterota bacterium]
MVPKIWLRSIPRWSLAKSGLLEQTAAMQSAAAAGPGPMALAVQAGVSNQATLDQDVDFIMATHSLWENAVSEQAPEAEPAVFIAAAEGARTSFRSQLPTAHFPHSDTAHELAFSVIDETLRLFHAAQGITRSTRDFHEQTSLHLMDIRMAVQDTHSQGTLARLRENVARAVDVAIEQMRAAHPGDATLAELRFVFIGVSTWEDACGQSFQPDMTPARYVATAEQALEKVKQDIRAQAPSERAFDTAVFVVEKVLTLWRAAQARSTSLPDFGRRLSPHMDSVWEGFHTGLEQKSLDRTREYVDEAVQRAIQALEETPS